MAVIYDKETDKYYGVAEEARRLGVSFTQLSEVLKGNRISKRLMARVEIKQAVKADIKAAVELLKETRPELKSPGTE